MDLRTTASGVPEKTTDTSVPLTEYLSNVRADFGYHIEQMMPLIKQRAESLQKESSRQLEADIAELRLENRALRDRLTRPPVYPVETRAGAGRETPTSHNKLQDAEKNSQCWIEDVSDPAEFSLRPKISVESTNTDISNKLDLADELTERSADSAKEEARVATWTATQPSLNGTEVSPSEVPARASLPTASVALASSSVAVRPSLVRAKETFRKEKKKTSARSRIFGTKSMKVAGSMIFGETDDEEPDRKKEAGFGHAVFADASAMKERVRAAVTKPEYNVSDYYWESGFCQAIARHPHFEHLTLLVIAFNAVWISVDADENKKDLLLEADPIFQIAEHSFCTFFTFEWVVRFLAFREKRFGLRDAWFCFDSALVIIMILETWVMTLLFLAFGLSQSGGVGNTSVLKLIRLVRLTRMARMAKLLRAIPELIILIKGIWVAARSVLFTLVLLVIIIYVFAIVFRQLTDDTEIGAQYYSTVPNAMASLLLDGILPDQSTIVRDNGGAHLLLGCLQLIFILLSSLTVMNMLVGILCEVVSVVSAVEKEQLTVNYVKHKLQTMFTETDVDLDGSMTISRVEFAHMLENTETASIIQDLGVDVIGLVDFADVIFEDDTELSFGDFMEVVLQLRGSNHCTVKDLVDFRKFVVSELNAAREKTVDAISELIGASPIASKARADAVGSVRSWMTKSMAFESEPMLSSLPSHAELPGSIITQDLH